MSANLVAMGSFHTIQNKFQLRAKRIGLALLLSFGPYGSRDSASAFPFRCRCPAVTTWRSAIPSTVVVHVEALAPHSAE